MSPNVARRTKIVATLGPASDSADAIRALLTAGADVLRLNFSHGTQDGHRRSIRLVREAAAALGREVALLQDLCGPKIRTGRFEGGRAVLEAGREVTLTAEPVTGSAQRFSTTYPRLPADTQPGARILLADGAMELEVLAAEPAAARCRVVRGGTISDNKGVNLPGTHVSLPSVTAKDMADLDVGLAAGVDFVALSFVRHPDDILKVRRALAATNSPVQVIAKIEKPEAIERIDAILDAADGILVARGDLGVELPLPRVPVIQKQLVRLAAEKDKYAIVATQMLESMIQSDTPTRAEVADVANAILDGADAVMLSGETAIGRNPARAVAVMHQIALETEAYIAVHRPAWDWGRVNPVHPVQDAIGRAAYRLCDDLQARAVVAYSTSGGTALFLSKSRPPAPILAFTASPDAARRMRLFWGVVPVLGDRAADSDGLLAAAREELAARGLAAPGDTVVLVCGKRFGRVGSTDTIETAVL